MGTDNAILRKYLIFWITVLILFLIALLSFSPADFINNIFKVRINEIERFNSFFRKLSFSIAVIFFVFLFYKKFRKTQKLDHFKLWSLKILEGLAAFFSLRAVLIVSLFYIAFLFIIGIASYDLGTDEVSYILYAKAFYEYGFAFCTLNGKLYLIDNYAMLPLYISSIFNFVFGLIDVWHFKFTASVLSIISIAIIYYTVKKVNNNHISILFLLLLIIQPGFGFVAISFFGEIVQACFVFTAAYYWLFKGYDQDSDCSKRTLIAGLLLSVAIQTKFQLIQPIAITLILLHFIDRTKRPLRVLIIAVFGTVVLAFIRFIPAVIYEPSYMISMIKFWYLETIGQSSKDLFVTVGRLHLFNGFLSMGFFVLIMVFSFNMIKTDFERFIYYFSLVFLLWWVFYFHLSNYRVLFIGIIPFCYIAALFVCRLFSVHWEKTLRFSLLYRYLTAFLILLLMIWGFSTNIIFAIIGYNDGVQFTLDGSKSLFLMNVTHDNSQKDFYTEIKQVINPVDTVYIVSGGQAVFIPQFFLGSNTILDYDKLKESVKNNPGGRKLIIVDRTGFPISLEPAYEKLDALGIEKNLLLKKGEFELYEKPD